MNCGRKMFSPTAKWHKVAVRNPLASCQITSSLHGGNNHQVQNQKNFFMSSVSPMTLTPSWVRMYSSSVALPAQYGNKQNPSGSSPNMNARPSYQVYGETAAFTLKVIPPEFRMFQSGTVIVQNAGRLLLEWTERNMKTGKYGWDQPLRLALSVEEAGWLLSQISRGEMAEFQRQTQNSSNDHHHQQQQQQQQSTGGGMGVAVGPMQKVFRAFPRPDGSVQFIVDFESNGQGGQKPPSANEPQGPLEVSFMAGEYQVIKSIMEYSLPRLIGWAPMMEHSIQNSLNNCASPAGHRGSGGTGGFFDNDGNSGVPF